MSGTAKPLNALLSASMDCLLILVVSARPVPELPRGSRGPSVCGRAAASWCTAVCPAVVRGTGVVDASVRPRERAQPVQLHVAQVDVGGARRAEVEAAPGAPVLLGEERKVPVEVTRRVSSFSLSSSAPGNEPFVACSDHHDSSSRAGRPKRSKLANSRFGSIGSSTQRPYDSVGGMSVAPPTKATTTLIFSPRNVRTFS